MSQGKRASYKPLNDGDLWGEIDFTDRIVLCDTNGHCCFGFSLGMAREKEGIYLQFGFSRFFVRHYQCREVVRVKNNQVVIFLRVHDFGLLEPFLR